MQLQSTGMELNPELKTSYKQKGEMGGREGTDFQCSISVKHSRRKHRAGMERNQLAFSVGRHEV